MRADELSTVIVAFSPRANDGEQLPLAAKRIRPKSRSYTCGEDHRCTRNSPPRSRGWPRLCRRRRRRFGSLSLLHCFFPPPQYGAALVRDWGKPRHTKESVRYLSAWIGHGCNSEARRVGESPVNAAVDSGMLREHEGDESCQGSGPTCHRCPKVSETDSRGNNWWLGPPVGTHISWFGRMGDKARWAGAGSPLTHFFSFFSVFLFSFCFFRI
jgi:hypothetical protein